MCINAVDKVIIAGGHFGPTEFTPAPLDSSTGINIRDDLGSGTQIVIRVCFSNSVLNRLEIVISLVRFNLFS